VLDDQPVEAVPVEELPERIEQPEPREQADASNESGYTLNGDDVDGLPGDDKPKN
jgi:hypothetical protein